MLKEICEPDETTYIEMLICWLFVDEIFRLWDVYFIDIVDFIVNRKYNNRIVHADS